MRLLTAAVVVLLCALVAYPQGKKLRRRRPDNTPECSSGAICFAGEVSAGDRFNKPINDDLEFVLRPTGGYQVGVFDRGWEIEIVSSKPEGEGPPPEHCSDALAMVVNAPYRQHNQLDVDMTYGWTADDEVGTSPRVFRFVTNCADFRIEYERFLIALSGTDSKGVRPASDEENYKTVQTLGSNANGKGRMWITASKISHAHDSADDKAGEILSMKFSVEIVLPGQ